jgi:hypothetical protein
MSRRRILVEPVPLSFTIAVVLNATSSFVRLTCLVHSISPSTYSCSTSASTRIVLRIDGSTRLRLLGVNDLVCLVTVQETEETMLLLATMALDLLKLLLVLGLLFIVLLVLSRNEFIMVFLLLVVFLLQLLLVLCLLFVVLLMLSCNELLVVFLLLVMLLLKLLLRVMLPLLESLLLLFALVIEILLASSETFLLGFIIFMLRKTVRSCTRYSGARAGTKSGIALVVLVLRLLSGVVPLVLVCRILEVGCMSIVVATGRSICASPSSS